MSRSVIAVLAILLLGFAGAVATVQAQRPTKEMAPSEAPSETDPSETEPSATERRPESKRDNASAGNHSNPRRQAGRLSVDEEGAVGRYVQFRLDLPSCTVLDFRVYGKPLFSEIRLPASDCRSMSGGPQGRLEIRGEDVSLRAHDAPNALLQFRSENGNVEIVMDSSVAVTPGEDALTFTLGNLTGRLFDRNGTGLTVDGGVVAGREGSMMVHPASGTSPERREIFEAIQRGKVGAETDLLFENGSLVSEILTYDDVQLKVDRKQKDRFDFTVDGNLSQGRVFITNIDPGVWDPARMRIDYADVDEDGRTHAVAIREADNLQQVLDFDPGKGPVYFVFQDEEGWHTAVAVPEFSVHVFQMVGLPLQVVPLLLYGVVIGSLFFVAGGVGIVLERRARSR